MAKKASSSRRRANQGPDFANVVEKIQNADEMEGYARMLVFGRSGAGKTRLAASAPNVLLIDVNEKGTDSVRKDFNPPVYPVDLWSELQDVYWYLASGDHKYESVAIDGVTAMQNLCMKFVLGDEASRDASRDPDMPSRQIWGKVGELMKTQITNYRNLPMNVIFTALQRVRSVGEDEDVEGEMLVTPGASPSIGSHLEAAVGIIGYLTTREVKIKGKDKRVVRRRLYAGPSTRYLTKDRYFELGAYVDNPNLTKIFRQIYGEKET